MKWVLLFCLILAGLLLLLSKEEKKVALVEDEEERVLPPRKKAGKTFSLPTARAYAKGPSRGPASVDFEAPAPPAEEVLDEKESPVSSFVEEGAAAAVDEEDDVSDVSTDLSKLPGDDASSSSAQGPADRAPAAMRFTGGGQIPVTPGPVTSDPAESAAPSGGSSSAAPARPPSPEAGS